VLGRSAIGQGSPPLPRPVPVGGQPPPSGSTTLAFADVAPGISSGDAEAIGWNREVVVRWGDRVSFDAPPWDPANPSVEAAERQFGWDARVIAAVAAPPAADQIERATLVATHPTVEPSMMWPAGRGTAEIAAAAQGATILNLKREPGSGVAQWVVVDGGFQNRRLDSRTLCRMAGPLEGDARLQTLADPSGRIARGILAPWGGALTPWGTVLLGEGDPVEAVDRLARTEPRFAEVAEANRFGWAVEFDPLDIERTPVKRTALGRFAHGDSAVGLAADGRAAIYATERRAGGFLLRFLTSEPVSPGGFEANAGLLDRGTLSVARIAGDRLVWAPLPATPDALLQVALAARAAGGTPLAGPSGLAVNTATQKLYVAELGGLGSGSGRILELETPRGDHGAASGLVTEFLRAGDPRDPAAGARYPRSGGAWLVSPCALACDGGGRLWIGTGAGAEGQMKAGLADAIYACDTEGPGRGLLRRFYAAPRGATIGGLAFTPGQQSLLAAVRRPGFAAGASFANPGTRWPEATGPLPPRSTVVALSRSSGGPVGG